MSNENSLRVHAHNLFHRRSREEINANLGIAQTELQNLRDYDQNFSDVFEDLIRGNRKKDYDAIVDILTSRLEERARRTGAAIAKVDWGKVAQKTVVGTIEILAGML